MSVTHLPGHVLSLGSPPAASHRRDSPTSADHAADAGDRIYYVQQWTTPFQHASSYFSWSTSAGRAVMRAPGALTCRRRRLLRSAAPGRRAAWRLHVGAAGVGARDADAKQFNTHPGSADDLRLPPRLRLRQHDRPSRCCGWTTASSASTLPRHLLPPGRAPGTARAARGRARLRAARARRESGRALFRLAQRDRRASRISRWFPPKPAKRDILRCCAMMENWAPGQRPLLR